MRGDRWGIEGPPEEAYSRVTNPERFQPLHAAATELLDRLEREFGVERLEGHDADDEVCVGRIRTNVPTPGYNIQSLFRTLPQHTVALRCAKSLELPGQGKTCASSHKTRPA